MIWIYDKTNDTSFKKKKVFFLLQSATFLPSLYKSFLIKICLTFTEAGGNWTSQKKENWMSLKQVKLTFCKIVAEGRYSTFDDPWKRFSFCPYARERVFHFLYPSWVILTLFTYSKNQVTWYLKKNWLYKWPSPDHLSTYLCFFWIIEIVVSILNQNYVR